jgi:hypothetical protein
VGRGVTLGASVDVGLGARVAVEEGSGMGVERAGDAFTPQALAAMDIARMHRNR